jgi:hypothetical protein
MPPPRARNITDTTRASDSDRQQWLGSRYAAQPRRLHWPRDSERERTSRPQLLADPGGQHERHYMNVHHADTEIQDKLAVFGAAAKITDSRRTARGITAGHMVPYPGTVRCAAARRGAYQPARQQVVGTRPARQSRSTLSGMTRRTTQTSHPLPSNPNPGAALLTTRDQMIETDESEQRSQAATARPFGDKSSHQRAVCLAGPAAAIGHHPGHKGSSFRSPMPILQRQRTGVKRVGSPPAPKAPETQIPGASRSIENGQAALARMPSEW